MRIKKLEIAGFKSFADRASFSFGDGITGVVGPNGCGKSNVVDAIRWCMGEMSAKHLRGKAMQDVIFAGSEKRGPLGMAEVTLTFHNDGQVPPQFADYSEIAVTRRLHRDGASEYLINRTPVRLRDITDLFLGTGVGTRAYSIIEQGRIGFVVNSRPEDRRSLIEEVAGITKFKARKKAAERRMEATQLNLGRVNDIIQELDRQLGSLRRQARKAERYKELKNELRDLELRSASLELLRLRAISVHAAKQLDRWQQQQQQAVTAVSAKESTLEVDRLRLLDEEKRLQNEQAQVSASETKLTGLEKDLEHWRRQLGDIDERIENARLDLLEAEEKKRASQADLNQSKTEFGQVEDEIHRLRQAVESKGLDTEEIQGLVNALDQELEKLREQALEHVHGAAQQRSELTSIQKQREFSTRRLEEVAAEGQSISPRQGELRAILTERRERLATIEGEQATWRHEHETLQLRLDEQKQALRNCLGELEQDKEHLSQRRSRLESLQNLSQNLEGFADGVRTLMGQGDNAPGSEDSEHPSPKPVLEGIVSLVADVFEADPRHEKAIEAVLGEQLQYLVVEDHEAAVDAIDYLRGHAGGRGGFVPVKPRLPRMLSVPPQASNGAIPALECIRVKDGFEGVAASLLGRVLVVDSLNVALSVWKEANDHWTIVTSRGEVLGGNGVLFGGADLGHGLLARQREIRELEGEVQALEQRVKQLLEQKERLEGEVLQSEVNLQTLDKDLRSAEIEVVELRKDIQSHEQELQRINERLEIIDMERQRHQDELADLDEQERQSLAQVEHAESDRQQVETRIGQAQNKRREHALTLEQRSSDLTAKRVELATNEQKLAAMRSRHEHLRQTLQELENRIARNHDAIDLGEGEHADLRQRIAAGETESGELSLALEKSRHALAEARAQYENERGQMGGIENEMRSLRKAAGDAASQVSDLQLQLERNEMSLSRLQDQIFERYDVDLRAAVADFHRSLPLSGDEKARQKELESSIKQMGPINLMAIDECAEVEQRHGFLTKQRDDLEAALDSLRRAIQRMNRASRERFRQAFDAVNEMFQKVYPRLFRGGEARLELTNAEDLLEAGVDIVASPPGKKLQNVNLLSGGEKALTATALVFSIFLIKPSPFCVLDEVDAPLDEANVGRFNEMLREIAKISQFIVITHNKNTMTEADRLYGVTMEDPGMSKVVSVNLEAAKHEAA